MLAAASIARGHGGTNIPSSFDPTMTPSTRASRIALPLSRCLTAALFAVPLFAQAQLPPVPTIGDGTFPGTIALAIDATDQDHRVQKVTETIPVASGHVVLLYPQWLPGTHSPSARLDQMSGLECGDGATVPELAGGVDPHRIAWTRDPLNVWAFHFDIPAGVTSLTCRFDFLSPLEGAGGREVMTPVIVGVQWNQVLLYPAGYDSSRILFKTHLTLPAGFYFATALESDVTPAAYPRPADGGADFKPVNLETLVDSPLFSGKYMKTFDLDPGGKIPVRLNVVADREINLNAAPDQLDAHRKLVQQAYKLYGSQHYAHYDFLFALSDQFGGIGLEHHQSSENGVRANYFNDWKAATASRGLLPHEYTHSWDGKFRRPADLTTPNYNVPMQDSLLWVYEGQTQYWGNVLAARSGLWDLQTARDVQASVAAAYDARAGRVWRNLQDTTNAPIVGGRGDTDWTDWVRGADYYDEMDLVWLDVDTKIRELSNNKHSLDDFAKSFFGVENGRVKVLTYKFDDIVAALNAVQPYDWRSMLRARLDGYGPGAPLDGLARSGWKLVFDDKESDYAKSQSTARRVATFAYSLGFDVTMGGGGGGRGGAAESGRITNMHWNGPGFKAGLTPRMAIVAVNGRSYSPELLRDAVKANSDGQHPIELIVRAGDYFKTVKIDYRDGLRYPHLARIDGTPDRLTQILSPKS
jgi:predicted metalloprotease with PDZ domain